MRPLRLVLFDATCGMLTLSWRSGAVLYRGLDRIDAAFGARSWREGLAWLASVGRGRDIEQIQYWGHGQPGRVLLAKEALTVDSLRPGEALQPALEAIRGRLAPEAVWWFRTCRTLGDTEGHRFATEWTRFFERPVAGHTWVIGPMQAGLHVLRPGSIPDWSIAEGDPKRERGVVPLWLRGDAPRVTCFGNRIAALEAREPR